MRRFARFIMRWELLWLSLLTPFLFFPGEGRGLAAVVLPLLWFTRWIGHGRFIRRTPLDWPLLLLLLMVGVSLTVTYDLSLTLPKATGVLLGIAFFYALAELGRSPRGVVLVFGYLIAASSAIAAISLVGSWRKSEIALFRRILDQIPRMVLELPGSPDYGFNPNSVAGTLLFVVPLLLLLLWPYRNITLSLIEGPLRWLAYPLVLLAFLLIGGTLLLAQSKGGYLGLMVGLTALVLLPRPKLLLLSTLLVALLGGALLAQREQVLQAAPLAAQAERAERAVASLGARTDIWAMALAGIEEHPATGMGMGTFRRLAPERYVLGDFVPDDEMGHAHNHLLAATTDLGLPGLIAYLAIWLGTGAMLWEVWKGKLARPWRLLAVGLAAGLVGQFSWAMLDANVLGSKGAFPFWLTLGGVAALHTYHWQAMHDGQQRGGS